MTTKTNPQVAVIGGGLAGSEAAWQLASREIRVTLFEMRPTVTTPAHKTGSPAELVCSNSFKSTDTSNAHGLLKAEMEAAGSLIISAAKTTAVPAGSALAVDRDLFSKYIETQLQQHPLIDIQHREITDLDALSREYTHVIIASGPLMSDALSTSLQTVLQDEGLYFYDAIAPVVYSDSINMDVAFRASRYDKGDADYINCPMSGSEYYDFVQNLISAKKVPFRDFEKASHFEGCLPVEVMAERGADTLSFGPMKPVGLTDPRTGERPFAVLQLRQENREGSLYNLVGCQTRMTWPEQKRVFQKIPGLETCEFARFGSMHRNTYLNAPRHLNEKLRIKNRPNLFVAGQLTGVEGYSESTAMGIWTAMQICCDLKGRPHPLPNRTSMTGGLVNYLMTASEKNFQPMNANFGLLQSVPSGKSTGKKERRAIQARLAMEYFRNQLEEIGWHKTP